MNELYLRAQNPRLLWENNPALVQLLGLSPLLAVSSRLAYGLALGLATLCVCILACSTVSVLRHHIPQRLRLVWFMLILAGYASAVEILIQLYFYPLSLRLGVYIPLICCNAALLLRMETFAATVPWPVAAGDALKTGLGFLIALVLFSACRELLVSGSLFAQWQILLPGSGSAEASLGTASGQLFRFADTPAGAFILLGLLLALINFLSAARHHGADDNRESVVPATRARVTGRLNRDAMKDRSEDEQA